MNVLKLDNLSKYYTTQSSVVMGLTGISLSFDIGEFVAVTGESGSGKSTLAHVLGGIIPYESGELYVYGSPTSHYDSADWERYRRDMIGFISQSYGILAGNTVLENVVSTLRFYGIENDAAKLRAMEILEEVELAEFATRKAGKLSSGQKQRLSIARALAKPSKILIADEPTGNLDPENSMKIVRLLKNASRDRLVIIITHEFSEVEGLATRRITLSDGVLVTDAPLADAPEKREETKPDFRRKDKRNFSLCAYVSALTVRSHPVLTSIVCLLLAAVTFITFVLLGTFTVSLDDTPTRIYSSDAFLNGEEERIVVMRSDGALMTEADYEKLLSLKRSVSIERYGYISDINYYYREGIDYRLNKVIVNGPNYHPAFNPLDFYLLESPEFYSHETYLQSVPLSKNALRYTGALPEGTYEIASSDPAHSIGDSVTVYFKNRKEWAISYYVCMTFKVTAKIESDTPELYFSDKFSAMMNMTMDYIRDDNLLPTESPVVLMPYEKDAIKLTAYLDFKTEETVKLTESSFVDFNLNNSLYVTPLFNVSAADIIGRTDAFVDVNGKNHYLNCAAVTNFSFKNAIFVTPERFDQYINLTPPNQASLYITDYAYTDRVLDELADMGYFAVSPFRLGATQTDNKLAAERKTTLIVCAAAFVLILVLQIILMRAIFSSLYEYFRLMSNIGLLSKTAKSALVLLLTGFTLIGEAVGAGIVILLNAIGVTRVVNIFKYLEPHVIAILFLLNTVCIVISAIGVVRGTKKAVFTANTRKYDLDMSEIEEA